MDLEPCWEDVVGDLVEILLELGETRCARRTLDFYRAAERDRRWRVGTSVELRCRGLLRAVDGDLGGALDLLESAVAEHGENRWPADLGRALLARGGLLRVLGHTWQARADLKRALAVFARNGAASWHAAALRALVGTVAAEPNPWTAGEPGRILTALTGGHWTDQEIASRLQLSLMVVQREMGGPGIGMPLAGSF
ncbi:MAG: hypothetical protein E6J03_10835 [Chloroflexi bacterium]|nr:MAG: hypothetical protein E6J03_10835 [Chloroflexota bacterium]